MAESDESKVECADFSSGIQKKSSRFLQKDNEVDAAENVTFDEVGGFGKKLGYTQEGGNLTSTTSTSTSSSTTSTSSSTSSTTTA
jgi:hypothetical protein